MLTTDQAICLRTVTYSETSQIVTLFGRTYGKISAIAKGSRRAKSSFDGPLEIFSFGDIVYSPGKNESLCTLTEFQQSPVFLPLRRNLFALNCGLFGAELLDSLTHDYDPSPDLFDSFVQFLEDIQQTCEQSQGIAFLLIFQLTLLKEVGLAPVFSECVNCKNRFSRHWRQAWFSSAANGVVCQDCEQAFVDKSRLPKEAAECFADLKQVLSVPESTIRKMERSLIDHFTHLLHRPPKTAKYLLQ